MQSYKKNQYYLLKLRNKLFYLLQKQNKKVILRLVIKSIKTRSQENKNKSFLYEIFIILLQESFSIYVYGK